MDLIRRYLSSSNEISEDAGVNAIEILVERLQTATRVEDRRDSMRGIKALSKRYRLEVGTQAMSACVEALSRDSEDTDTVSYAMDALCNMMNDSRNDVDPQVLVNIPPDLGKQFTEIFVKDHENVHLVLSFLSSYDMHLRRQTIHLLILLLQNNRKTVQDLLLNSPMAVSKFMATLSDPMEVIRNDGLLLLFYFTKHHPTIQKIVAFENVFERVLSIVETETVGEGGVVVEDCFRLLHQLLVGNQQNQILFKDGRFVQRLAKLFEIIPDELEEASTWSAQKLVNIFRALVSPSNKSQCVKSCQSEMEACGLLNSLWKVVMAGGVPAELLTETLYSLGELVRGCPTNQESLASMVAPSKPPQPAITVLLVTMVNDRQQLPVRLAVLYCFQCLLADNKDIQSAVVSTLLPKDTEQWGVMSAGQLLCGGLFSQDGLAAWFSAIALFHSIHNNRALKESLLQVHMAPSSGSGPPVTLMQQCFRLICQSGRIQGKIGLLQFLCAWLAHCPLAVEAFLTLRPPSSSTNSANANSTASNKINGAGAGAALSHLIADVLSGESEESATVSCLSALLLGICVCYNNGAVEDYDCKSLMKIIDKRIGIDDLVKRIGQAYRSDEFVRVIQQPVLEANKPSDLVFDYDFTQLFKTVEFEVCSFLTHQNDPSSEALESTSHANDQDSEEAKRFAQQQELLIAYQRAVAERDTALQHLQLRVIELERQLNCANQNGAAGANIASAANTDLVQSLTQRLEDAEKRITELQEALKTANEEKESIKSEHEDLLLLLSDQESQIGRLSADLEKLSTQRQQEPTQQLSLTSPPGVQPTQSSQPVVSTDPVFAPLSNSGSVLQYPPLYSYDYQQMQHGQQSFEYPHYYQPIPHGSS
nr:tubby [Hymenolepis microstoma]